MNAIPKILASAGSARQDSYNKKLVWVAAAGAQGVGVEVTLVDLRDFPMPLYDGDLEAYEGIPENALTLTPAERLCGFFQTGYGSCFDL